MSKNFWLLKTEPSSFAIDSLAKCAGQTTCWDGVRNYQARNMLRDKMAIGDGVFIYHSRQPPMAIVGTAVVARAGYPDPSQFDAADDHFDPLSPVESPRWYAVDIRLEAVFSTAVTRPQLRELPELADMMLLRRGDRLSVQPVAKKHWDIICALGSWRPLPRRG